MEQFTYADDQDMDNQTSQSEQCESNDYMGKFVPVKQFASTVSSVIDAVLERIVSEIVDVVKSEETQTFSKEKVSTDSRSVTMEGNRDKEKETLVQALNLDAVVPQVTMAEAENRNKKNKMDRVHFTSPLAVVYEYVDIPVTQEEDNDTQILSDDSDSEHCDTLDAQQQSDREIVDTETIPMGVSEESSNVKVTETPCSKDMKNTCDTALIETDSLVTAEDCTDSIEEQSAENTVTETNALSQKPGYTDENCKISNQTDNTVNSSITNSSIINVREINNEATEVFRKIDFKIESEDEDEMLNSSDDLFESDNDNNISGNVINSSMPPAEPIGQTIGSPNRSAHNYTTRSHSIEDSNSPVLSNKREQTSPLRSSQLPKKIKLMSEMDHEKPTSVSDNRPSLATMFKRKYEEGHADINMPETKIAKICELSNEQKDVPISSCDEQVVSAEMEIVPAKIEVAGNDDLSVLLQEMVTEVCDKETAIIVSDSTNTVNNPPNSKQLNSRFAVVLCPKPLKYIVAEILNSFEEEILMERPISKQVPANDSDQIEKPETCRMASGDVGHKDALDSIEKCEAKVMNHVPANLGNKLNNEMNQGEGNAQADTIDNVESVDIGFEKENDICETNEACEQDKTLSCSPAFIPASQVLSQNSQDYGSTGFECHVPEICEDDASSQVSLKYITSKADAEVEAEAEPMEIERGQNQKVVFEIAEEGMCTAIVDDKQAQFAVLAVMKQQDVPYGQIDCRKEQEKQLNLDSLDDYVDKVVEQVLEADHTVPGGLDTSITSDEHDSIYDQTEDKKTLYACDADICGEADEPLCSPVSRSGFHTVQAVSCFKWKYTPSCDISPEAAVIPDLPTEDQTTRINPLKTCGKPLRLGLSRRQPVNSLHRRKLSKKD